MRPNDRLSFSMSAKNIFIDKTESELSYEFMELKVWPEKKQKIHSQSFSKQIKSRGSDCDLILLSGLAYLCWFSLSSCCLRRVGRNRLLARAASMSSISLLLNSRMAERIRRLSSRSTVPSSCQTIEIVKEVRTEFEKSSTSILVTVLFTMTACKWVKETPPLNHHYQLWPLKD